MTAKKGRKQVFAFNLNFGCFFARSHIFLYHSKQYERDDDHFDTKLHKKAQCSNVGLVYDFYTEKLNILVEMVRN